MSEKNNVKSNDTRVAELGKLLIQLERANQSHKTIKELGTILSAPVSWLMMPFLKPSKMFAVSFKARLLAAAIVLIFFIIFAAGVLY